MGVQVTTWITGGPVSHHEHVGFTVGTGSTYLGDCDSDFYAVVFDPETGDFITVGHGYSPPAVTIDAPQDILDAYALKVEAEKAATRAVYALNRVRTRLADEAIEDATPRRGKRVMVVRGLKVPIGTEGTVKVYCETTFGYRTTWRVLLVTDDGVEHWTAASNVEVIHEMASV